jgi:hypothetical protein
VISSRTKKTEGRGVCAASRAASPPLPVVLGSSC